MNEEQQARREALDVLADALKDMHPDSPVMSLRVREAMDHVDDLYNGAWSRWGVDRVANWWWFKRE